VQQQPQPVVGEAAEAVPDAFDLLIWNGAVKGGAAGERLLVFGWRIGSEASGPRLARTASERRGSADRHLMFAGRDRTSAVRRR